MRRIHYRELPSFSQPLIGDNAARYRPSGNHTDPLEKLYRNIYVFGHISVCHII